MSHPTEVAATLDDLYRCDGKAELIAGKIVPFMPTGRKPNRVASRVFRSLDDHAEAIGVGEAYTDNIGFVVANLASERRSFSPDASYFLGPFPSNAMRFIEGPPTLAVEVRSQGDYGEAAETEMAAKRADYFEAGTPVVWDVDPIAEVVRAYQAGRPGQPEVFVRGQEANAEPAVHGWRIAVGRIFA